MVLLESFIDKILPTASWP